MGERERLVAEQYKRIYRQPEGKEKKGKKNEQKHKVEETVESWLLFGPNWSGKI